MPMSAMMNEKPLMKPTGPARDTDSNPAQSDIVPMAQAFLAWGSPLGTGIGFGADPLGSGLSGSAATGGTGSAATGTGSGTGGTTGSAAVPSWISALSDSVIKADMTAVAASGTVSEAGMTQLFLDLAAELTANKATLSASQLSDLKTIAADLNFGETA
jgi:hypothetical protein